jgi:ubiquinol oxidase
MKVLIQAIVSFFVLIVDVIYGNRSYARFYVLETIVCWLIVGVTGVQS